VVAQYWKVPFYVYWGPSTSFENIDWSSLFESPDIPIEWIGQNEWNCLRSDVTQTSTHLDKILSYLNGDYKYSFADVEPLFQRKKIRRITAECNREMSLFHSNILNKYIPRFQQRMIQAWTAFVPCHAVREIVYNEVSAWITAGAKHVLGIHVRKNEALSSRLGNRFTQPSDSEIEQMISQQVDRNGQHDRLYQVFVATDDPHTATTISTKFGTDPNVRMFQWKRYPQRVNTPVNGQQKAVADLYVLRFCDAVKGTQFSVFTQLAQHPIDRLTGLPAYQPDVEHAHGLLPEDWDPEPEPIHLIQERKKREQKKLQQIQKIATKLVKESMNTAVNAVAARFQAKHSPTDSQKTDADSANPTAEALPKSTKATTNDKAITEVGVHVTIIGRGHNEYLGRRGITLGLQNDSSIRVCVDADRGIIISVKQDDIVAC
jgi:hypothetical protein